MLNKYIKFGMVIISILFVTTVFIRIFGNGVEKTYAQASSSYLITPVPSSTVAGPTTGLPTLQPGNQELLRYCPAIFDNIAPIICIDDGQGHCLN